MVSTSPVLSFFLFSHLFYSRGSIEKNRKRIKEIRKERRKNKREQEYHTILIYQKEGVQRKQIQEQKKEIKSIDKRLKRWIVTEREQIK